MKIIFIIVITILILAFSISNLPIFSESVRPIKIKVVDSGTKLPLAGLVVYYKARVSGLKNILGFPFPEYNPPRTIILETYYTDEKGELILSGMTGLTKLYKDVYSEYLCINLDILNDAKSEHIRKYGIESYFFRHFSVHDRSNVEMIFNPLKTHKGYLIYSVRHNLNDEDQWGTERQKFNVLWNGEGLLKKDQSILVELERYH